MNDAVRRRMQQLGTAMRGRLLLPTATSDYDDARRVFNGMFDRRPVAIAQCADVDDVVAVVRSARDLDLPVAVRGGGHSIAGHGVCDGGLMIDMSAMRGVGVDPIGRSATAGGGATWEVFDAACQRHGLATTGGTFDTTGVAGLTLGGGIGHLMGRCGLACDNLVGAQVVTGTGDVIVAGPHEDEELLWGLRGGGGNFGVVTELRFRLHEVGAVYGGVVVYPFSVADDAVALFRDVMLAAPDALTCTALIQRDDATGQPAVFVTVCVSGAVDGPDAVAPLLTSLPIVRHTLCTRSYVEVQQMLGRLPFGLRHYWKGHFVSELPLPAITRVVEHFSAGQSHGTHDDTVLIEPLHGVARRTPDDTAAFGHRVSRFNVSMLAIWRDAADDAQEIAWARRADAVIGPWSTTGAGYVNYMSSSGADNLQATYGHGRLRRLQALKARVDPQNLLRFNHNIPPLAVASSTESM